MFIVRLIHMAAVVLVAGAFAFRLLVVPSTAVQGGQEGRQLDRWLWLCTAWGVLFALLSWAFWLALVAMRMSGRALSIDVVDSVLSQTTFGQLGVLRSGVLLLSAVHLFVWHRRGTASSRLAVVGAILAAALLMSLPWGGHAVGTAPPWRAVHLAADAAHLLGAGLWLGALVPLLLVWHAAAGNGTPAWHAVAMLATQRFSSLGVVAVTALALTGFVNACFLVGSFSALVDTDYGRLVMSKVALFAVIIAIAAVNRFKLRPRLSFGETRDGSAHGTLVALRRNALVELCLGVAILVVVANLGLTPPSVHGHEHEHEHMDGHSHHHSSHR
jgi:putative copper resistance protein D